MDSCNPLSKLLDTNRLTGPNFNDWLRNLRMVLSLEKIEYVLDNPLVKDVQEGASDKWRDDNYRAWCYMLASMTNLLQEQYVNTESAYEILMHLHEMYADLGVKRFSISKKLFSMRLSVESSFNEHVLSMVNYIRQLEELGASMSKDLAADLILQSLPKSFSEFIMDYNMNKGDYDLSGFVNMLISAEANMKKAKGALLGYNKSSFSKAEIKRRARIKKTKPKSKVGIKKALLKPKCGGIKKAHLKVKGGIKKEQLKPSGGTAKSQLNSKGSIQNSDLGKVNCQGTCFHCGKEGHIKKDCRFDTMPTKSFEKSSEPGVVNCQGKCFRCGKEGHLEKDCRVDIMPSKSIIEKSGLEDVNFQGKCFRCGKEGHFKKDCSVDILPTNSISSVQENSNDWHMWKKPEFGWIKLNTDGCSKGFGGLYRDHDGKPICAYIVRSFIDDIFTAELFAVLRGISLAYLQGIKDLWVELDSMSVVKTIRREQPCPPKSAIYLDQILQLIGLFQKFQISHSWRECNQAADHLSKMDFRVNDALVHNVVLAPNDFPESLCTIIKEDAAGRLYYRQTSRSTCQTAAKVLVDC